MKYKMELDSSRVFEIIKREKTLDKAYTAIVNETFEGDVCFTKEEKIKLSEAISELKVRLENHNIKFWIDWGTFLGAYRSNEIISWDKDFDISILSKDKNKTIEIIQSLPDLVSITENKKHYLGINVESIKREHKICIDINVWDYIEDSEGSFLIDDYCQPRDYSFFEKLDSVMLEDLDLLLPCPTLSSAKDLLTIMYGENFMLPPGNPLLDSKGRPWFENRG